MLNTLHQQQQQTQLFIQKISTQNLPGPRLTLFVIQTVTNHQIVHGTRTGLLNGEASRTEIIRAANFNATKLFVLPQIHSRMG